MANAIRWKVTGPAANPRHNGETRDGTCYRVELASGWWRASWWYDGDSLIFPAAEIGNYRDPESARAACEARES